MKHLVLISFILLGCGEDDKDSASKAVAAVQASLENQDDSECPIEGSQATDSVDKRDFKEVCE